MTCCGLLFLALAACSTDAPRKANLQRCLADEPYCDVSVLSDAEHQQVLDSISRRHFQDCLAGLRCNEALLTEPEQQQVRLSVAQLNFQACLRGEGTCRESLLTEQQRREVEQIGDHRNLEFCIAGLTSCNEAALTDPQRAAAWEAYSQRNFAGCMNAVGTLVTCNRSDLSAEQRALVDRRNLAVNVFVCSNALMGCNQDLLTPEQRDRIATIRGAQPR